MNDIPREKLQYIITQYGRAICDEPKKCEGLLRDLCPKYRLEINLLIVALKERVAAELMNNSLSTMPKEVIFARLIKRLHDNWGFEEEFCQWAVESWAAALGIQVKIPPPSSLQKGKNRGNSFINADSGRSSPEGEKFGFETVFVDSKGKIVSRKTCTARQRIENLGSGVKLEMVYIPGGTFMMGSAGSEANRDDDESPRHKVTLSPFFMGKYQVTQRQWEAVMDYNPSHFAGANRPVEKVSWEEAVEFCSKLSKKTGESYRLPTEAEWEYACRAGTTTPFYFGETITPDIVNYDGNYPYGSASKGKYREATTDVGSFPPNSFGLYDMHGNVWEWCRDWFGEYPTGAVTSPQGPSSGSYRVFRGGCWSGNAGYCRSADRGGNNPSNRGDSVGFRLAFSPGQ